MKIYDIENICGTVYILSTDNKIDEIDNLMQVLMFGENNYRYINHENWEYNNIRNLTFELLRNNNVFLGIFPASYSDPDNYCSYVNGSEDDLTKRYEHIFDLSLHDAAVKATYNAAQYTGELANAYARLACQLWQHSRQLRQYVK